MLLVLPGQGTGAVVTYSEMTNLIGTASALLRLLAVSAEDLLDDIALGEDNANQDTAKELFDALRAAQASLMTANRASVYICKRC